MRGMRLRITGLTLTVLVLASAPAAAATPSPGEAPLEAGASNMGYCSALLAQQDAALGLAPTARAEVNKLLKLVGPSLGYANPGELYREKAQTSVAEDDQCQQR